MTFPEGARWPFAPTLGAFALVLLAGAHALAADERPPSSGPAAFTETADQRDARMQWFRDAHFGMFIHWGLYSQLAGEWRDKTVTGGAEWIQNYLNIPSSQYSALTGRFNPARFDADAWAALMQRAGVKYIAITTKHHDGFCMWPTRQNDDWNIAVTPFKRDPLAELSRACGRRGVRFGIYHSVLAWHHPDWPVRPAFNDYARKPPDKARFKAYRYAQLKELFTRYGPMGIVWFDGTWDRDGWTSQDGKDLEDYTRSLQPSVILDNRSGYQPEQRSSTSPWPIPTATSSPATTSRPKARSRPRACRASTGRRARRCSCRTTGATTASWASARSRTCCSSSWT